MSIEKSEMAALLRINSATYQLHQNFKMKNEKWKIKYVWRFARKNGVEDLDKADYYLQRLRTTIRYKKQQDKQQSFNFEGD